MPRISLVTPTFNQAGTIRETIESVLGQDHRDLDYWVMDAGSTDGTVAILKEYEGDPRFHWISEPDRGQGDAINKGLVRATGEIFNWINSDDYLAPGTLAKVAAAFEKNSRAEIVSGLTAEFRGQPAEVYNHVRLQLRDSAEESMVVGVFCQPSTFWRTEIFRSLGGLDGSLHFVLDWHLWLKYLARYGQENIVLLDDNLAFYRQHAGAKTTKDASGFYREADRVFRDLNVLLKAPVEFQEGLTVGGETQPVGFEFRAQFDRSLYFGSYCERMVRILRRNDPAKAKAWLKRSFSYEPGVTLWRLKMFMRLAFR